jgi:hypothetical protein
MFFLLKVDAFLCINGYFDMSFLCPRENVAGIAQFFVDADVAFALIEIITHDACIFVLFFAPFAILIAEKGFAFRIVIFAVRTVFTMLHF